MKKLTYIQIFSLICFILLICVIFYPIFSANKEREKLERFSTMKPVSLVALATSIQTMEKNITSNLITTANNVIAEGEADITLAKNNLDMANTELTVAKEAVVAAQARVAAADIERTAANTVLASSQTVLTAATTNQAGAATAVTAATSELDTRRGTLTEVSSILSSGATAAATAVTNPTA